MASDRILLESPKDIISHTLLIMGIEPNYITKAFKIHDKNYGDSYNVDVMTGIIMGLQNKKKQSNDDEDDTEEEEGLSKSEIIRLMTGEMKEDVDREAEFQEENSYGEDTSDDEEDEEDEDEPILLYTQLAQSIITTNNNKKNLININITICGRFKKLFVICCSYSDQEKFRNIFVEIEQYLHKIYYPRKIKIDTPYITGLPIYLRDGDVPITKYNKWAMNQGITIETDGVEPYEHKIDSVSITCEHMNRLKSCNPLKCPIYYAMKEEYDYTSNNLSHLNEFIHFENEYESKPSCKYGENCRAYIRHETGTGGDRLDDKCHMKIYKHPPRNKFIKLSENIHSLIINKSHIQNHLLYSPNKADRKQYQYNKKDGYLQALIKEVIDNGFKNDLCLECGKGKECKHSDYSILQIVEEKMKHIRHQQIDSPLRRDYMLALILYTGCDCNYDLCAAQRNRNYEKWKWFDMCLYNAIGTLSKRENGDFMVYSGLDGVQLDVKNVENGYFVTYVSSTWKKEVSERFMGGTKGMIMQIDKEYKNDDRIRCCDVSWISKFPDECEILFARTLNKDRRFNCVVLDDANGVQTVSLKKGY